MIPILLWFVALHWIHSNLWPQPYNHPKELLLYVGTAVFVAYACWRHRTVQLRINWLPLVVLLYLLVSFLSLINASSSYEGILALSRWIVWGGLAWLFSKQSPSFTRIFSIISLASVSAIVIANLFNWTRPASPEFPFITPLGHVSYYGNFIALHLPMAFYLLSISRSALSRSGSLLALGLVGAGLWYSGARAPLLASLLTGLLITAILLFRKQLPLKRFAQGTILILLLGLLSQFLVPHSTRGESTLERFKDAARLIFKDPHRASGGRWDGYKRTLLMIRDRPLIGWGPGNYRYTYPAYYQNFRQVGNLPLGRFWYTHPHNELLNQAAEVGIFGFLLFLIFCGGLFLHGFKHRELFFPVAGLLIEFFSSQFDTSFLFPLTQAVTAFYVGLYLRSRPALSGRTIPVPSFLVAAFISLAAILLIGYSTSLAMTKKLSFFRSEEKRMSWSRTAYHLAPGAFETSFPYAAGLLHTQPPAQSAKVVDRFYKNFSNVPVAMMVKSEHAVKMGDLDLAEGLLKKILISDPSFSPACYLLESIGRGPCPKLDY